LVNELNLEPQTYVKIKDIDVEVIKGELSQKPWLIESDGENYVLLEESQYDKMINLLKEVLTQNVDLKMEQKILEELPVDLEDVKVVVKKEIDEHNISIPEAIKRVKTTYPNLFMKRDFEFMLENLF